MNRKNIFFCVFVFFAIGMRVLSEPTAYLSYLLLAGYALRGRVEAIQALALSWFFTMISPGLGAEASAAMVGRYVVLLSAAFSVFVRSALSRNKMRVRSVVNATLLLGAFIVIHSWLFSPMIAVSALKAVSWTIAMTTLIAAWGGLATAERDSLIRLIFAGLTVLMIASLPLLFLPLGYLRNGTGFQGVLNHPQAFGPTMALLAAWCIGGALKQMPPPWSAIVLAGACMILVLLSETRTAGVALLLGVGIAVILAPLLSRKSLRAVLPSLYSKRTFSLAMVALASVLLASTKLEKVVVNFISKSGRQNVDSVWEAYEQSRGSSMSLMWSNIKKTPLQGIGFGIASLPGTVDVKRDPMFGLPIGAAVEKGVLPLALLEELGLFGFAAVTAWGAILLRRFAGGGIQSAAVGLTALMQNFGEATLFSPGGLGLLPLLLIAWAVASDQQKQMAKWQPRRTQRQPSFTLHKLPSSQAKTPPTQWQAPPTL